MADDIRGLSAALARDPSSLQYVELAEALRQRGKFDEAIQVVMHGLGRHAEHADGFDCLARIHTDRGSLEEARAAWERALAIVPEHLGALKGIGFLYYRQGDRKRAADALEHALAANPHDDATRRALAVIRGEAVGPPRASAGAARAPEKPPAAEPAEGPPPKSPADVPQLRATAASLRALLAERAAAPPSRPAGDSAAPEAPSAAPARPAVFSGLEGATADILLLDARGLVMAGGLKAADGSDVSELAAAALAGVSGEAGRTATYLGVGPWTAIVAEAELSNVILAPVGEGALLMLRRERSTPVGLAARIADRARAAAARWLEQQVP